MVRLVLLLPLLAGPLAVPGIDAAGEAGAREHMVATQIAARDVSDPRVLDAMRRVERHAFVPASERAEAYGDHPLPIGHGQTISQPYIVALMTELARVRPGARVLEIGTGSGYQAAVLAVLAREVYSIEIVEALAREAAARLKALGYANVTVRAGDGYRGWPDRAPFDAILVTAAPPEIPQPLLDQLAVGGRLVAPVGEEGGHQELVVVERTAAGLRRWAVAPVRFVPMTGEAGKRR
jgi:protein-L-isoaspartate(D-aspartate) O-methyltransferase